MKDNFKKNMFVQTRTMFTLLFSIGILFALSPIAHAATINAATCNQADVQDKINLASDGDTVSIPAGTCTWSNPVRIGEVAMTVQGAGIDQTIIIDNMAKGATKDPIPLTVTTAAGKFFRLTGLTFQGNGTVAEGSSGLINLNGTSKAWRIDHVKFDQIKTNGISVNGWTYGVIDHNIFNLHREKIKIFSSAWGGGTNNYGDGSFAESDHLGTDKAIYIENNTFLSPAGTKANFAFEGWRGGRFVFRHNIVTDNSFIVHGTESSGRDRGIRTYEVYDNTLTGTGLSAAFLIRGGTGVIFNNTITGFSKLAVIDNFRSKDFYPPWGQCDGTSPYDVNDGVTYDTGTHTGGTSSTTMTTTGKTWTINQWQGYSLHNTTTGKAALITANTANTITYSSAAKPANSEVWNTGDTFTILRATVCLDQVGRGAGDLLSGVTPTPVAWPHQALEGIYSWNNTLNGNANALIDASRLPGLLQANRDYFDNTPKPGYTPYTYPHPLTLTDDIIPPIVSITAPAN